ncbi:MAG: HlyD family secretion protein, partial [Parcubacteria group bacterium]
NLAEVDIANIKIGNTANVTLDAFGPDRKFSASVVQVNPAETVVEGLPTYKITLMFSQQYSDIKSGLTANLDILTAQKSQVLVVPQRAVIAQDGKKFVQLLNTDNTSTQTEITTGLRGVDGNVEIVNGLIEGQKIVANPQ